MSLESELSTNYSAIRQRLWGRPKPVRTAPIPPPEPTPEPERWPEYTPTLPYDTAFINLPPPSVFTQERVKEILRRHGETIASMKGDGRGKKTIVARREVARFLYDEKGWGPTAIARYMNRDHSSACNLLNPERSLSRYAKHKALVEAGVRKTWKETKRETDEKPKETPIPVAAEPLELPADYQGAIFGAHGWHVAQGSEGNESKV